MAAHRLNRALAVAAALVATGAVGGVMLGRAELDLYAPPLFASLRPWVTPAAVASIAVLALVVWRGPAAAATWSWGSLVAASVVVAAAWGLALAVVGGPPGIVGGLRWPFDHLALVDGVSGPGAFVDSFVERFESYPVHVRGHPPGLMPLLWWMDRIGLGGPKAAAGLAIALGASIPAAAAVVARSVGNEDLARRALPFLVMAPAAVWWTSSFDAIFAGVGAWGVALVVVAIGGPQTWRTDLVGVGGGLLLGYAVFLSYGMTLLGLLPLAVAIAARRWRPIAAAVVGASAVALAFAALGFWWFDGLELTRQTYAASVASTRPYAYFVIANLAAFAVAVGPASVAGLGALRDRRLWLVVGAGLAIVALADLSGLSKGEVERIWLPFWPWVGLAAAGLRRGVHRGWLGAQAGVALLVEAILVTPW